MQHTSPTVTLRAGIQSFGIALGILAMGSAGLLVSVISRPTTPSDLWLPAIVGLVFAGLGAYLLALGIWGRLVVSPMGIELFFGRRAIKELLWQAVQQVQPAGNGRYLIFRGAGVTMRVGPGEAAWPQFLDIAHDALPESLRGPVDAFRKRARSEGSALLRWVMGFILPIVLFTPVAVMLVLVLWHLGLHQSAERAGAAVGLVLVATSQRAVRRAWDTNRHRLLVASAIALAVSPVLGWAARREKQLPRATASSTPAVVFTPMFKVPPTIHDTLFRLRFVIDADGRPERSTIRLVDSSGRSLTYPEAPGFVDAVRNAVAQWHFLPSRLHGQAVQVSVQDAVVVHPSSGRGDSARRVSPYAGPHR